jgi:uncharacterized protein (DUF433 family)
MPKDYVEYRDGRHYITSSRIPLTLIASAFATGASPEEIRSSYPTLTLEPVYGAITFCLANQSEIEAQIAEDKKDWQAFQSSHPIPPELKAKLESFRLHLETKR